jgi:hypothetical protein
MQETSCQKLQAHTTLWGARLLTDTSGYAAKGDALIQLRIRTTTLSTKQTKTVTEINAYKKSSTHAYESESESESESDIHKKGFLRGNNLSKSESEDFEVFEVLMVHKMGVFG